MNKKTAKKIFVQFRFYLITRWNQFNNYYKNTLKFAKNVIKYTSHTNQKQIKQLEHWRIKIVNWLFILVELWIIKTNTIKMKKKVANTTKHRLNKIEKKRTGRNLSRKCFTFICVCKYRCIDIFWHIYEIYWFLICIWHTLFPSLCM